MGHPGLYNKNQIRDKLLLVLIFFEIDELSEQQDYGIRIGGAYGKRFFILHNGLQRKLL